VKKSAKKVDLKRKRPHGACHSPDLCAKEDKGLCTCDDPCEWREITGINEQISKALEVKKIGTLQKQMPDVKFSQETFDLVCDLVESGLSTREACTKANTPSYTTFKRWQHKDEKLRAQYVRSIEARAEAAVEEMSKLDDQCIALVLGESEDSKRAGAIVGAYKNKTDNVKWVASKLVPRTFGTHTDITSGGKALAPNLTINVLNVETGNILRDITEGRL
jgi:hypothetical protein